MRAFLHQGQICVAAGRHLVHRSLYSAYVSKLASKADQLPVGDPATAQVALGPVIDAGQRDRIQLRGIHRNSVGQVRSEPPTYPF